MPPKRNPRKQSKGESTTSKRPKRTIRANSASQARKGPTCTRLFNAASSRYIIQAGQDIIICTLSKGLGYITQCLLSDMFSSILYLIILCLNKKKTDAEVLVCVVKIKCVYKYIKRNVILNVFVCCCFIEFFVSFKECFTDLETSPLPVRGCKFDLCSAYTVIEQ